MDWICNNGPVSIITHGGYTVEEILSNKHCSKEPSYWYPIANSDRYLFKSSVAESWEFFDPLIDNPVSNTNQIYLRFINTSGFTSPRDDFKLNGYYCVAPEDTIAFNQFWDEEEDVIDYGFEVDGVRITGRYYWWLNYGRLKATENKRKIERFADFIDHQYYWSLELEECGLEGPYNQLETYLEYFPNKTKQDFRRLRKMGMIVSKSRRKGYSYFKSSALHAYNFTWLENSMNILSAFEKGHYKVPLDAIHMNLNFLNKNTPWVRRRDKLDTRTNFRASVETSNEFGVKIEEGFKSEVNCISFKDDPFKGIGDSVDYIDVEEAGKFTGLLETYAVSIEPLIRDGDIMIGIPLIGGTSGDMDKGSVDLYTMQCNPDGYGCKSYSNIYDGRPGEKCGYFIDDRWMLFGFIEKETIKKLYPDDEYMLSLLDKYEGDVVDCVDSQGNSHRRFAEIIIQEKRKVKRKGDSRAYNKFISQQPLTLEECYLVVEGSPFDVAMAKERISEIKVQSVNTDEWGEFIIDGEGSIQWRFDMSKTPIIDFPIKDKNANLDGCWVLHDKPRKNGDGNIPWGRYLAGHDPIDKGEEETNSGNSHSLASCFIMDSFTRVIVAEYSGRPNTAEQYYEQLWRGLEFYCAEMLYENNLKGVFSYFRNKNKTHLLADAPDYLKDKIDYKDTNAIKGVHATPKLNQFGRDLINSWSLEEHPGEQDPLTGEVKLVPKMYTIKSIPLLQEMRDWRPKLNCDRISAMGLLLILVEGRVLHLDSIREGSKNRIKDDKFFKRINNVPSKLKGMTNLFENILDRR